MIVEIIILTIIGYIIFVFVSDKWPKRWISSDGKAVLITGCDSGSCKQLAHRLCEMGFRVYATVLSKSSAGALELKSYPLFVNQLKVLRMNVTNDCEVNKTFNYVKEDLIISRHVLWAVVNGAGVHPVSFLEWGTLDTYSDTFDVNVLGTVRVIRAFLPLIRASKGRIVIKTSFTGRIALKSTGIYSMTMSSLIAFSNTLRREMKKFQVDVSIIEPAYFKKNFNDSQKLLNRLEKSYDQSSDEVKESYGCPNTELKLLRQTLDVCPLKDENDPVVDDLIDSVVNLRPRRVYRHFGVKFKILFYLDIFFPALLDGLLNLLEKIILSD